MKFSRLLSHLVLIYTLLFASGSIAGGVPLVLTPRIEVNPPAVTFNADVSHWLQRHPRINVGVWGVSQPPVSLGVERGVLAGIDADYLSVIESTLNVHFQLLYFPTRSEALSALHDGDIDMLAIWRPALEKNRTVAASLPWLHDQAVVLHSAQAPLQQTEIENGLLALMQDKQHQWDPYGASPNSFLDYYHAVQQLATGESGAITINRTTAHYLTRDLQMDNVWLTPDATLGALNFSFGVNSRAPQLLTAIDQVLDALPLVSRLRISHDWGLNQDAAEASRVLALSPEEIAWLAENQPVKVVLDSRLEPYSFINAQGKPDGLSINLLKFISDRFGFAFDYHVINSDREKAAFLARYPQALVSQAFSVPGEEETTAPRLQTGTPWLVTPPVLLMNRQHERPLSLQDLSDEKIAIVRQSPLIPWLQTWYPTLQLVEVENLQTALHLLKQQQVRAVVASQFAAQYHLKRTGIGSLYQALALPVKPLNISFAAKRDNPLALSVINKALQQITPLTLTHLAASWRDTLPVPEQSHYDAETSWTLFIIIIAALLIAGCLFLWVTRLRNSLKTVARHLQSKEALIEQLERATAENQQVLHSRNQFMKSMGHEVRTPLNAMMGLLELELSRLQQQKLHNENVQTAYESACILLSLVGDVFDIFRAEARDSSNHSRVVNIPSLLHSTVALFRQQAEDKGLQIKVTDALPAPMFEFDPLFIIRIVSSLLRNAIQHTEQGEIEVAIYPLETLPDGSHHLVIEVSDQGSGFDAASALMNNAELTEEADERDWAMTGFSLAACQRMAHAAGAEITAEVVAGKGSAVSLHLSAHPARLTPITLPSEQKRSKVLIVEDYPPARLMLSQQLQNNNHEVLVASNGQEGLDLWKKHQAQIDVIITDCTMPEMDGFTMTRHIRQQEANEQLGPVPILGLTAMSSFDATKTCLSSGMNTCLTKPLSPEELAQWVERHLHLPPS